MDCVKENNMCDEWKNSRDAFAEWYSANYYECDGERMAVDKDLLCRGNKEYAPDKCCILPETINSALASATKRRSRYKSAKVYAIGVDYDKARDRFYARITPFGHNIYFLRQRKRCSCRNGHGWKATGNRL